MVLEKSDFRQLYRSKFNTIPVRSSVVPEGRVDRGCVFVPLDIGKELIHPGLGEMLHIDNRGRSYTTTCCSRVEDQAKERHVFDRPGNIG